MPRGFQRQGLAREISPDYDELSRIFDTALRARGRADTTRAVYTWAIRLLGEFLLERGMPTRIASLNREHLEEFMADLRERRSEHGTALLTTGTVSTVYRRLHAYFAWLVDVGEIDRSPMEKMKPPSVQQAPPSVMTEVQIRALLATCSSGRDFRSRRDYALMVMLLDTGCRREELATARVKDIDWDAQLLRVVGKGNRVRQVAFGHEASIVLRQYIRARRLLHSQYREDEALWIGHEGPLKGNSIYLMIRRRAREAGVGGIYCHLWRHTWAHLFLEAGGQEGQLKQLGGWRSDEMLRHYGSSEAARRAQKAHAQFSPASRILKDKKKG
jgi:site-specific recombinase XerD